MSDAPQPSEAQQEADEANAEQAESVESEQAEGDTEEEPLGVHSPPPDIQDNEGA